MRVSFGFVATCVFVITVLNPATTNTVAASAGPNASHVIKGIRRRDLVENLSARQNSGYYPGGGVTQGQAPVNQEQGGAFAQSQGGPQGGSRNLNSNNQGPQSGYLNQPPAFQGSYANKGSYNNQGSSNPNMPQQGGPPMNMPGGGPPMNMPQRVKPPMNMPEQVGPPNDMPQQSSPKSDMPQQGASYNNNQQGSPSDTNQQGSPSDTNTQGSPSDTNKQSSPSDTNTQGSPSDTNPQGSPSDTNTQGSSVHSGQQASSGSSGLTQISSGLAGTIHTFCAAEDGGSLLPDQDQVAQVIVQALARSDISDRVQTARNMKAALDGLADQKVDEARAGSGNRNNPRGEDKVPKEVTDKIAAALLETIAKFCSEKRAGGPLPTAQEINQILGQALKDVDLKDSIQGASVIKGALDHIADDRLYEAQNHHQ